jgi:hypothetical protein
VGSAVSVVLVRKMQTFTPLALLGNIGLALRAWGALKSLQPVNYRRSDSSLAAPPLDALSEACKGPSRSPRPIFLETDLLKPSQRSREARSAVVGFSSASVLGSSSPFKCFLLNMAFRYIPKMHPSNKRAHTWFWIERHGGRKECRKGAHWPIYNSAGGACTRSRFPNDRVYSELG